MRQARPECDMYTHELVTEERRYEVRRRHSRFLVSVPASLTRAEELEKPAVHGLSLDLSWGGGSAVLCGPPAVGEMVCLKMQFSGSSLEALAVIRHSNSMHSGFEFVGLSPAQRAQLETRIRTLEELPRLWPVSELR